jgi:hypothetical protein
MRVTPTWLAASLQINCGIPDKSAPPARDGLAPLQLHPDSPESREDCIRKSLAERLKSVCAHLSPEDFDALVLKMTYEQLRSEGIRWRKADPC